MHTPKIRFAGYKNEWQNKKLKELTHYTKGFAFKSNQFIDKGYRVIRVSDLLENSIKQKSDQVFISISESETYEKYKILKDDILVTTVGSKPELTSSAVGRAIYISENVNMYLNQNLLKFESSKLINNYFLYMNLKRNKYKNYISLIQRGNANQSNITVLDLLDYQINIPSYEEQEKIGSLFSLLNEKIQKQQEKVELLQAQKKGLMQKIFSQELRFKDENGQDYPDWEKLKFFDVVDKLIGGGTPSRSIEVYYNGTIPWVTVKDLKTNKYITDAAEHITELGLKNSSSKIVNKGDLIIPTRMAVGRVLIAKKDVAINQDLKGCKLKSKFDTEFIYYLYLNKSILIERLGSGSTVSGINIDDLMNIKMEIPSIKEQKKIAKYLASIDMKLEKEKEKVNLLVNQKKGFIQNMFI